MADRWQSKAISCSGGLILSMDTLLQGTQFPGSAVILQNYECAISGGYRRLSGFIKFDTNTVPGTTNNPILGVKVALGGIFAVRKLSTDNAIYFSSGTGWGTKLNSVARTGSIARARIITYSITKPVILLCDGVNPAWKYDGATETDITASGAPANPKYAALFKSRLALSGYGDGSLITLSAPNDDEDYAGADGAIEVNVGDTVVGLKTFRDELIIFCQRSIKKITGNDSTDFALVDIANSIGCLSGDTIEEIAGDLVYLAADSIRSFSATVRIDDKELGSVSQSIQPLIQDILDNSFDENAYSSCCIRQKSQYRLFINDINTSEVDAIGIIGKVNSTPQVVHGQYEWSTMKGIRPYCADSDYINNQEFSIFGHPTNGIVYRMESGNTFDGVNIEAIYNSPDLTFDDATLRKVFHKINLLSEVEGDFETQLNLLLERGQDGFIQPKALTFSQDSSAAIYDTAIYDTSRYGEFGTPIFKRNLIGSGFFGAFSFSSTTSKAPHRIDSYQITFSLKGRR